MSKIVMVCSRTPRDLGFELETFLQTLAPDNLPGDHVVTTDGRGLHLGVYRPHKPVENQTAYVGWLREPGNGSCALFKGGDTIGFAGDAAASRGLSASAAPAAALLSRNPSGKAKVPAWQRLP